ncbi:hypothetical protein MasN3_41280 [Massilia varians]|uniref:Polysaccharide pyruvyl transferase domain-containing protein n=1 Tax=Massilia varians TaxID=457921 RepID=A0ABN6TKX1_9BURK|nr:polysaccharide pyruvyl transferase family protein [Massilia varians]BDT60634.1 hypothetical protein MasN3_41280 [Massilia varians]
MKIALITIHWAANFGAALQTFATQSVLNHMGHHVAIIDYRNAKVAKTMMPIRFGSAPRDILRVAKDLLRFSPRLRTIRKFKNFLKRYIHLTERINTIADLKSLETQYDAFVSGSDQVWNPLTINDNGEFDRAYFLDFIKTKRKVSYASSMGSYKLSSEKSSEITQLLCSYDALAVRESGTCAVLSGLLEREVEHVLDPTLLLTAEEWVHALDLHNASSEKKSNYVLAYALHRDSLFRETAQQVAKQLGYELIAIDQDPILGYKTDYHLKDAGPNEFVSLINGASYIVTSSFHGTAFALNFRKQFVSVVPTSGANRIESLLDAVGLRNRLISSKDGIAKVIGEHIEFDEPLEKLSQLRAHSLDYLERALIS